ncbi:hypothetical protein OIV83_001209 [Microbotryomycetes sp. JL201]|nr:hypothetical protein OIV83_001209 [Microbotryomycetes sp. JL201]
MEFLNDLDWTAPPSALVHADTTTGAQASDASYADLFQQYLGAEVAKLPPSAAADGIAPPEDYPFASSAPITASAFSQSDMTFDPSTFMPAVPGSPIGAFSPSSDNSGQRFGSLSPTSFPDLDETVAAPAWTLDPSLFGPGPGASSSAPPVAAESQPSLTEPLLGAALPDLPALPAINEQEEQVEPSATQSGSGRSKRQLSVRRTVSPADESEDSDASDYGARPRRRTTSKKQKATTPATPAESTPSSSSNARQPKTSVSQFATKELHFTNSRVSLPPVPDWTDKPDPETYKRLSSKEKRQLRNKISARNFRHRRKEQLTGLEEEIQSRDQIIAQLRDEVGVMQAENVSLRSEVNMLKQKWDEMISKMTNGGVVPPPSPAATGLGVNTRLAVASTSSAPSPSAVKVEEDTWALDSPSSSSRELEAPAAVSSGRRPGTRAANGIVRPNLNKDVAPGMPRRTNSWTTNHFGGGFTSVHTTMLPDINFAAANANAKPALYTGSFNPVLNALSQDQAAQLPGSTSHLRGATLTSQASADAKVAPKGTFEDFFGSNPLWLRADQVEEYRASLYGKLAHNAAGLQASHKSQQSTGSSMLSLPAGFRPAFFSTPSHARFDPPPPYSPSTDAVPAEKCRLDVTAADFMRAQSSSVADSQTAVVASLATQTLFSRLTSSFFSAFMGDEPSINGRQSLNPDKVAAVLSGQSRLAIVPTGAAPIPTASSDVDSLDMSMSQLSLQPEARHPCSFDEIRRWISGRPSESFKPNNATSQ